MSNEINNKYDVIPNPPTILSKVGQDKYFEICKMLVDDGSFKSGDDISILALCVNYQRWLQAERAIKKNKDLCFETKSGYRQQIPELSIAKDCQKTMLTFIKEFALTLKQRAQLKEMVSGGSDDEEMEDMIS